MKACVIQPPYSNDVAFCDEYFAYKLQQLDALDESTDIIVLPEYSDVPCATKDLEQTLYYHDKYIDILLAKCVETAKRCNAMVFVNGLSKEPTGYRNTTYCYDRKGNLTGKYFKKHLPPLELNVLKLDSDYTFAYSEPYVLEMEGIRFGFLTCYDFYFYEAFPNIARQNVDIIIGCSLQRSDTHEAIETMCRFLAYNTNAYVLRSSVSFAEDSNICGASMIVNPKGLVMTNMKGKFGAAFAEFDPSDKYYKPAGFGNPDAAHYQYIEFGRKPWQYRQAGSGIICEDAYLPYPRVCAHRGFNTVAPENSMAAFGTAVGMGADEIEFDLRVTADGHIVVNHDSSLDRCSNGTGKLINYTLEELRQLDFGSWFGEEYAGIQIPTFEEVLQRFTGRTIMNIHINTKDLKAIAKIVDLVRRYDCVKHSYFMVSEDDSIRFIQSLGKDLRICVGHDFDRPWSIVDRAIELGAYKVQFFMEYVSKEMIDKAHAHGILCNMFYSDDPLQTQDYLDMGIDTILTNRYNVISKIVK